MDRYKIALGKKPSEEDLAEEKISTSVVFKDKEGMVIHTEDMGFARLELPDKRSWKDLLQDMYG